MLESIDFAEYFGRKKYNLRFAHVRVYMEPWSTAEHRIAARACENMIWGFLLPTIILKHSAPPSSQVLSQEDAQGPDCTRRCFSCITPMLPQCARPACQSRLKRTGSSLRRVSVGRCA